MWGSAASIPRSCRQELEMKLHSSSQAVAEKTKPISKRPSISQNMMELHSRNYAAAIMNSPIPQIPPSTKKMTSSNVASPLLKLPPEVRNRIYYFVNGGYFIHIEWSPYTDRPFQAVLCRATVSEEDAQHAFETKSPSDKPMRDAANRHSCCFEGIGAHPTSGATTVSVGLLRTCRQIYVEAKYVLYSTNNFSFRDRDVFDWFCSSFRRDTSVEGAIRNIHLDMLIDGRWFEDRWNKAIKELGDCLHSVQHVQISISQSTWSRTSVEAEWYRDPTPRKDTFLAEISSLRRLNLKTLKISVFESNIGAGLLQRNSRYEWTHEQKQKWARDTEKDILSSN